MRSSYLLLLSALTVLGPGMPASADEALAGQVEVGLMPGLPLAPHDVDRSVKVGVIDSGVRVEHPQIGNIVGAVRDFTGEGPGDYYGHGTQVVLVLVHSSYKGLSPLASVKPGARIPEIEVAKVIGRDRASAAVIADRITDAVPWLASLGVRVVNISLSLPNGAANYERMCATMGAQKEIMFAIAAGNSGRESVVFPAACAIDNKIVVGAAQNGMVPAYSGSADIVAELPPATVSAAEYWHHEGVALYNRKDFAGAQHAFKAGLQSQPDSTRGAQLTHNLGVIALQVNDLPQAIARFEEATQLAPSLADSYIGLAAIYVRAARFDDARAILERGLGAGADSPALYERLARAFMDLDRPRDALRQIEELRRRKAEPEGLAALQLMAENMVKIEDAIGAGQTPLALAGALVGANSSELVRFIIRRWHPNLDTVPEGAKVPLLVTAATKGQRAIVLLLLESGAAIDAHDSIYRLTALMMAATRGQEQIFSDLLQRGADPELRDYFGFNALMFAAEAGHGSIVKMLLGKHVSTTAKSKDGFDALDYARKHKFQEIVDMIEAAHRCRKGECADDPNAAAQSR